MSSVLGRHIEVRGVVQGVGFRPWVYRLATEEGIAGRVRNDATGVTIDAFGSEDALDEFMRRLGDSAPPAAAINEVRSWPIPFEPIYAFSIVQSQERRFRYPFTNCTNCGPRFTITRDVPYDRPATTMAPFRMCPACQHEYDDVRDRRFHAQPNACPECGPWLQLMTPDGDLIVTDDPIGDVAAALTDGQIVAIKGLGGFHLACDATSPEAVQRLRVRKRRDEKPFAVMAQNVNQASRIVVLDDEERKLLTSVERPIVLATRRDEGPLAPEVAPNNPLVGVMLPYTPLHHLLMRQVGLPLVMTSANLAEEPLAYRNSEALERLSGIADLFLMHNREIETRCDDSVARVIDGAPVVFRRARGYVPRGIRVSAQFDPPVLACGALLKNTFCIGTGDTAYLGPHIGDLENFETYRWFEESVARMEKFLRVQPTILAHDLHPDYMSTAYALGRSEPIKIGVQHHHAHVASAMAEHGLPGPVIGVACDGTGYGTDGTAWGGEVLVARYDSFDRVATLRPILLAGGDAAIRQPWRIALALLRDSFGGNPPLDDLPLFDRIAASDVAVVRQLLAGRFHSPLAHGAGRYFDAIGSLVLARPDSRYEGQIALAWNGIADPAETGRYGYEVDEQPSPHQIDFRQMTREVVRDVLAGLSPSTISARFHNTLVVATADVVRETAQIHGSLPVVLTGGCFQNARLAEGLKRQLNGKFKVYLHQQVPPGDGGIALGQAVVAAAIARQL
jgi:hydrogenase maturation protein HypF